MGEGDGSHVERLVEGMVHVASRHGYAGASVARVIEQAGVSRATFYEHFANRESCFLTAYRGVVARLRGVAREAAGGDSAPPLRTVLAALLQAAAADPAGARLVLVEALAAPAGVRAEHERLIADLERLLQGLLDDQPREAPALQIPAAALLGALGSALSVRVQLGLGAAPPPLPGDLLAWLDAYALAPGESPMRSRRWQQIGRPLAQSSRRAPPPPPRALPRGESTVPPAAAAADRRDRILAATARATASKGYAALTVADIVGAARVTRSAFYSHFRGKQDAFLCAQKLALQESIAAAAAEFSVGATWPERVWGGLAALLGYLAEHPDLACLGVAEIHPAGEAAILQAHENRMAFALFLEDGYRQRPEAERLPRVCSEAIGGGIFGLMRRQVVAGRVERMLELLPQCAYLSLAPFTGPARAMEFVAAGARAGGPATGRERPRHPSRPGRG